MDDDCLVHTPPECPERVMRRRDEHLRRGRRRRWELCIDPRVQRRRFDVDGSDSSKRCDHAGDRVMPDGKDLLRRRRIRNLEINRWWFRMGRPERIVSGAVDLLLYDRRMHCRIGKSNHCDYRRFELDTANCADGDQFLVDGVVFKP